MVASELSILTDELPLSSEDQKDVRSEFITILAEVRHVTHQIGLTESDHTSGTSVTAGAQCSPPHNCGGFASILEIFAGSEALCF
eukprot:IDg8168t1